MPQAPPHNRLRRPFEPETFIDENVSCSLSPVSTASSQELCASQAGAFTCVAHSHIDMHMPDSGLMTLSLCLQVDVVGEGEDHLSDDSDLNEPENRKPRRTR